MGRPATAGLPISGRPYVVCETTEVGASLAPLGCVRFVVSLPEAGYDMYGEHDHSPVSHHARITYEHMAYRELGRELAARVVLPSDELELGESLAQDAPLILRQTRELLAYQYLSTVALEGCDLVDVERSKEVLHIVPAHRSDRLDARWQARRGHLLGLRHATQPFAKQ